jgi:hypothetical protein
MTQTEQPSLLACLAEYLLNDKPDCGICRAVNAKVFSALLDATGLNRKTISDADLKMIIQRNEHSEIIPNHKKELIEAAILILLKIGLAEDFERKLFSVLEQEIARCPELPESIKDRFNQAKSFSILTTEDNA